MIIENTTSRDTDLSVVAMQAPEARASWLFPLLYALSLLRTISFSLSHNVAWKTLILLSMYPCGPKKVDHDALSNSTDLAPPVWLPAFRRCDVCRCLRFSGREQKLRGLRKSTDLSSEAMCSFWRWSLCLSEHLHWTLKIDWTLRAGLSGVKRETSDVCSTGCLDWSNLTA